MIRFLSCPVLFLVMTWVLPALEWTTKTVEVIAKEPKQQIEASFPFRNTGSKRVTILRTESNCSCTVLSLEKKSWEPGESGALDVLFKPGSRTGYQQQSILVKTDEFLNPITKLVMRAVIPPLLILKPERLIWESDEPLSAKTVELPFSKGLQNLMVRAASSSDAELKQVVAKADLAAFEVLPSKATRPQRFSVTFITEFPKGNPVGVDLPVEIQ